MQVTQVQDHVNHAVIGGKKTQSLSIANTAEFFHILSSTLYSRKEEAMVREVICNAWDSHIESGITDTPIKISLDYDQLVIRDYGSGIPDDMIGEIYGTYGGSTKKDNKGVTGGFGLGSKSPWAYADHFEVTSCHAGTKTIYKMSLSSAMVGGKPSITTIVSVPTEETGITVTVKLKDRDDKFTLQSLIEKIVRLGEINCLYNDEVIDTIPFSQSENDFLIVKSDVLKEGNSGNYILIRYGNVVYPVEHRKEYAGLYESANAFLAKIDINKSRGYGGRNGQSWVLILRAKPDTISVTPSRESLSMTEHTMETIQTLLSSFLEHVSSKFDKAVLEETDIMIKSNWIRGKVGALFKEKVVPIPQIVKATPSSQDFISDAATLGSTYLHSGYPNIPGFEEKDFLMRLNAIIGSGFGDQRFARLLHKHYNKYNRVGPQEKTNIYIKKLVWPLVRKLSADPAMDPHRLHVVHAKYDGWRHDGSVTLTQFKQLPKISYNGVLNFTRNIIIISHNRADVNERVGRFPAIRYWFSDYENSFVYIVPRNLKKVEAAREFWSKTGMTIIDLTKAHPWEPSDIAEAAVRVTNPQPRKKGLPLLSAMMSNHGGLDGSCLYKDDAPRIEKPEFIVRVGNTTGGWADFRDQNYTPAVSQAIVRLWGSAGAAYSVSSQADKYLEQGAKDIETYVLEKLANEFKTNKNIENHYRWSLRNPNTYPWGGKYDFYQLIESDAELRKMFGIPDRLDLKEKVIVYLFENMMTGYKRMNNETFKELEDLYSTWKHEPKFTSLGNKIHRSELAGMISCYSVERLLADKNTDEPKKKKAREFILLALEG